MAGKRKRSLVAYLTIPNTLETAAEKLAKQTDAYPFPLKPDKPYEPEDLREERYSRTCWEANHETERPVILDRLYVMDQFTDIYLGVTLWWYGIPRLLQSFLEDYDYSGKRIIPFTTRSSPGAEELASRVAAMSEAYDQPEWLPLRILEDDPSEEELQTWIDSLPPNRRRRTDKRTPPDAE